MGLLNRDRVNWSRLQEGAHDSLGHPATTNASGFPITVTGQFQHRGADGEQSEAGIGLTIGAVFYSQFISGKIGDVVTFDSVAYTVSDKQEKRKLTAAIDHVRYTLVKRTTGDINGEV